MVEVSLIERRSAVLSPSALSCLSRMPTVNLSNGCAHGCLYCYTRGYSLYPGAGRVEVYGNLPGLLKGEIARKRRLPRAVYFSPSSDVFQPVAEVLDLAYGIFEYLISLNIGIALLSKGVIPRRHMDLMKRHPHLFRVQVGLITLDDRVLGKFEPCAANAGLRLAQIKELTQAGLRTGVRLDPILPGLTDGYESLSRLLEAVADAGVSTVAASVLFLRPAIRASLKEHLSGDALGEVLLGSFSRCRQISIHAENSRVKSLPADEREEIFLRVGDIARERGLELKICACKNPDLASGSCGIAGDWAEPADGVEQLKLFES